MQKVLVEETLPIAKELYAGLVLDRAIRQGRLHGVLRGRHGHRRSRREDAGEDSEGADRAGHRASHPSRRASWPSASAFPRPAVNAAVACMMALAKANEALDASLAEINPLIITDDGRVVALDAKITLDDNALFRHKDLIELRDLNEEDPLEVEASKFGLNYIKLDGNVACMVNGAGLAMATMDIIKYAGGSPANFLDVGGGANCRAGEERVPHPALRHQREGRPDQHLRRHPALRHAGDGRGGRRARAEHQDSDRGPDGRHERGTWARRSWPNRA